VLRSGVRYRAPRCRPSRQYAGGRMRCTRCIPAGPTLPECATGCRCSGRWPTPVIRTPEQGADTIVWLGGAPEAVETTGLFWHDLRPRPVTYLIGAGADDDAARPELWDHVAALARWSQARPA